MVFFTLPSAIYLQPYIELRELYEAHLNPTFDSAANKNRRDLYSRLRVGANLSFGDKWIGTLEYQNSHDLYWTHALNASTDNSDLSLGYLKYSSGSFSAIGGRQKIELGQQRLIGSTEWLNMARSFDAARARSGPWELWGGMIGVANTEPRSARIADLTHTDKTWGTTSLIYKHDLASVSDIDIQTLDHFVTHKFGNTTADAEGALQVGQDNGRDQSAWAFHAGLTQKVLPKTTLAVQADAASGGGNASTSRTFDNLYPSNHNLYGLADTTGWKNMNHLAIKLENKPRQDLTLRAAAHEFSLRDPSDAWYGATGVVNPRAGGTFVDPTGKSGRGLGQELDFEAIVSIKRYGTVSGGLAFFEPGDFVQNLSGHSNQMTFGYLQYQVRF